MTEPDELTWRQRYERLRADVVFLVIAAFTAGFVGGAVILKLVRE